MIRDFVARKLRLKRALRRMFLTDSGDLNEDAKLVVADLRRFCFADETTAKGGFDALVLAHGEGRRDVYLRLMKLLKPDASLMRAIETLETDIE